MTSNIIHLDRVAKTKMDYKSQRGHYKQECTDVEGNKEGPRTILFILENNKRYAHTAACQYKISMASLQPDERKLPHCVCNAINEERLQRTNKNEERVVVIVEHDLNEYVLCVLEPNSVNQQCKLNLRIQPGEQIAFRTIGKIPVLLTGLVSDQDS